MSNSRLRPLRSCAAALSVLLICGQAAAGPPEVGKEAPAFSLRDREGALVSLTDLAYPGTPRAAKPRSVVILDFFRTDCAPCRRGLAGLVQLYQRFKSKPVRVILVALLEDDEGQDKLDRFLRQNPLPFTVLIDPYGTAAKKYVAGKSGIQIPALFVTDATGVLRYRARGVAAEGVPQLAKIVESLLK